MTCDSLMLRRVVAELRELRGARVERVFPTGRAEFVLDFRARVPLPQITLNVSAEQGRAHRDDDREPVIGADTPLADVLRRHLRGATLLDARQHEFDRVVILEFGNAEGMGPASRRTLIAETMGRHSNLILTDERGYILECARHVTARVNRVRQLLPGEEYVPVPDFGKLDPETVTEAQLEERLPAEPQPLAGWLREHLQGGSDLFIALITGRLGLAEHATTEDLHLPRVCEVLREVLAEASAPGEVHVYARPRGKSLPYPVALPAPWSPQASYANLSAACLAVHGAEAELAESQQVRGRLLGALNAALEKVCKREREREAALAEAHDADRWRKRGDLILAHLSQIEPRQAELRVTDWETGEEIALALDPRLTPQENAREYFNRYKKLQRVRDRVPPLLAEAREERLELEDLLDQVQEGTLRELRLVEAEMTERGLLARPRKRQELKADYRRGETGGYPLLYGRSALENAAVLRAARPDDLWFHAQNTPGGHVVLRTNNRPDEVPQSALLEAAKLAARQSRRRRDNVVEVDYTLVKHLTRTKNAPPGFVVYREFKTLLVKPGE